MPTDPALTRIVSLTISSSTPVPSRPGFGAALLVAPDAGPAFGSALVRVASSPADVTAMGFASDSSTMRDANAYFGQEPSPDTLYVGRRMAKPTRRVTLTISGAETGAVFSIELNGAEYSFTAANNVNADVAAGLNAAIDAVASGYSKAVAGAVITLTATVPGVARMIRNANVMLPTGPTAGKIEIADTSLDPGIVDDLEDIFATPLGSQAFGLLTPGAGAAEVKAASAWATANSRLYGAQVFGTRIADANATNDEASNATADNPRFLLLTARRISSDAPVSAAILGRCLAATPGSINFAHKNLTLVEGDTYSAAEIDAVHAKNANVYSEIQRVAIFFDGRMGDGQSWADEVIGIEWLKSELQIGVFEELLAHDRIPYTDAGADLIRARVKGILVAASREPINILDPAREIKVFMPAISSLTVAQRKSRVWPVVSFEGWLQGAINRVQMQGKLQP